MAIFGVTKAYHNKFKFIIEIQGVQSAAFMSCSEIAAENNDIEHYEGGSLIADKTPGRVTVPDITLMLGATDNMDLYDWFKKTVDSEDIQISPEFKRTFDIVQQDRKGDELLRWTIFNAYPKRFKAGDWDNNADEKTVRELVLRYDYFELNGN